MRRKVHPSRPSASTCCLFSSLKTLLIPPEAINLLVGVNVPDDYLMAGFEVIMNGRFWASAEENLIKNRTRASPRRVLRSPDSKLFP